MRLAIAAPLLLALACSHGTTPPAPEPSSTTSSPVVTSAPPTSAPPTVHSSPVPEIAFFLSPSRNIGCSISATGASCDIRDKTWTPPSKPADCELDWGNGLFLTVSPPRSGITCAGDTSYDANARILAYGEKTQYSRVECASLTEGIRCRDVVSGKGFRLSRESYELF